MLLRVRTDVDQADWLVLTSVENRNALSERLLSQLIEQVSLATSSEARVLVLDHEGKAFCSGVDLRERGRAGEEGVHSGLLADLLRMLWSFPKPVIARVDGLVRGGGMAMLACSDFVVAGEASNFGYSEVRVGVIPALVTAVTFPKLSTGLVGPWMMSGEAFDALEARRIGLVTRTVPTGTSVTVEPELAALLRGGPSSVLQTKALLRRPADAQVRAAIDEMEQLSHAVFATDEAQAGMAAFSERRAAPWIPVHPAITATTP
jgi:methylglutaconyl-CoA hydratase